MTSLVHSGTPHGTRYRSPDGGLDPYLEEDRRRHPHVLIDIPVGPTAKIRSLEAAERLAACFGRWPSRLPYGWRSSSPKPAGPVDGASALALEALDVPGASYGVKRMPPRICARKPYIWRHGCWRSPGRWPPVVAIGRPTRPSTLGQQKPHSIAL